MIAKPVTTKMVVSIPCAMHSHLNHREVLKWLYAFRANNSCTKLEFVKRADYPYHMLCARPASFLPLLHFPRNV